MTAPGVPRTAAGRALLARGVKMYRTDSDVIGKRLASGILVSPAELLAIEAEAAASGLDVEGVIAELVHAESLVQQGLDALKQATDTLGGIARLAAQEEGA